MVKVIGRIPGKQQYSYVEIVQGEGDLVASSLKKAVKEMSKLVEDSAVENPAENLEVILLKKICPQCGNNDVLTAKIGFSQKNKKPYYRVKCAKKGCAFLSWVDVKEYKGEEL